MKILMIAPEPFFEPRGTPISVLGRLKALSSLGHEVDLITYHVGKDVVIPGIRIFRTPSIGFIKEAPVGAIRFYKLSSQDKKIAEALASLALDRVTATIALCIVGIVFWLIHLQSYSEYIIMYNARPCKNCEPHGACFLRLYGID